MSKEEWLRYTGDRSFQETALAVTPRRYEVVRNDLGINISNIHPDSLVLSIGEGLSNFSRQLSQRTGATVIAVDPIYMLGDRVFGQKLPDVLDALDIGEDFDDEAVFIPRDIYCGKKRGIPLPEKRNYLAGSVYDLPFPDESVDQIVLNRLYEHIDIAVAIPEMARVIKPDGEIRFGEVQLQVNCAEKTLFPGVVSYINNAEESGYRFSSTRQGVPIPDLLARLDIQGYVITTGLPKRPEVRDKLGHYSASILAIRKDKKTPEFKVRLPRLIYDLRSQYRDLMRILRITNIEELFRTYPELTDDEIRSWVKNGEWFNYYRLEEVTN